MRPTSTGRSRCALELAVAVGILSALQQPAQADETRPAERLVIFPMLGEVPEPHAELPASLTRVLGKATRARGMKVTMLQVSLEDTALMAGCAAADNVSCHELILEQLDADSGMTSEVAPAGEGTLTVTVRYFDGKEKPTQQSFEISQTTATKDLEGAIPALFGEPVAPAFEENVGPRTSDPRFDVSRIQRSAWFTLGSGGALMGVGTVFWLTALLKQGEIDDAPVDTPEDLERLADLERNARTRATVGNVLFFSGFAVAALGSYLAIRQARSTGAGPTTPADAKPASSSLRFAPVPMPGGAGVAFTLEWQ